MRLSAKAIKNYANINNFDFVSEWLIRANEPNTLYFQLVDLDQDSLRYIAGIGGAATITVNFPSVNDAQELSIAATQADAADGSVWKVDLTNLQVPNSGSVVFTIVQAGVTRKFSVLNMISVENPGNDGSC